MNIERDEFLSVIDLLALVPHRQGIPSSEYVKIEAGKKTLNLYLTSDVIGRIELGFDGTWDLPSPYFVDRNLLNSFVLVSRQMKSKKDFEIRAENKTQLVLKHGRRSATFTPLPEITGYGTIQQDKDAIEVDIDPDQREVIKCAESCATTDPTASHLNCVYLTEKGFVLSSNQILIFTAKSQKFTRAIPMPLFLLHMLTLEGVKKIIFSKKHVVLRLDKGEILQTVPQQALKNFPQDKILKVVKESSAYPDIFAVSATRLADILNRFTTYMSTVRKRDKLITVEMKSGSPDIEIWASVAQVRISEKIKAEAPATADVKAEWSLEMVLPIVNFLGQKKKIIRVKSAGGDTPYLLDGDEVKLVMARKY